MIENGSTGLNRRNGTVKDVKRDRMGGDIVLYCAYHSTLPRGIRIRLILYHENREENRGAS